MDEDYRHVHRQRGRHSKLSVEAKVLMTLEHLRTYPTYFDLSFHYGFSETTARTITERVGMVLYAHPDFRLPSHKELLDECQGNEYFIVDATATPIEWLKKQREFYSGKHKDHTLKSQLIVRKKNERIMRVDHAKGSCHDFAFFKDSVGYKIHENAVVFADSDY